MAIERKDLSALQKVIDKVKNPPIEGYPLTEYSAETDATTNIVPGAHQFGQDQSIVPTDEQLETELGVDDRLHTLGEKKYSPSGAGIDQYHADKKKAMDKLRIKSMVSTKKI